MMERKMPFWFIACLCFLWTSRSSPEFDWATGNTSIWLSSGAYCPTEVYLNRTYLGYSEGFTPTNIITDKDSDTAGYIGYMKKQSSIYIVMRGSVSFQNWIDDFDARQVPYNNTNCLDCYVHEGFSYAWNQVAHSVIPEVVELRRKFPTYSIIVTGHSLGGALASLCALSLQELFNAESAVTNKFSLRAVQKLHVIPKVRLFTFGAPRFSNEALAAYATKLLSDRSRVTHYKDMAPHCPPYLQYMHIAGEWYEDELGDVSACSGYEDPLCSSQWYYTSIADHMRYLGLPIGCSSVSDGAYQSVFPEPEEVARAGRSADKVPIEYLRARQQIRREQKLALQQEEEASELFKVSLS
mmetsp:Transcript_25554/g.51161  ORF Transcript_25554/g.51161 Transcript_25554/m.51161 type:complete len:354 (-) Transcript_25554:83-1144(-)